MQSIFAHLKLNPNKIFEIFEVKLSFLLSILHFKKVLFKQIMMATLGITH